MECNCHFRRSLLHGCLEVRKKIAQQLGAVDAENVGGADAASFLAAPLTYRVIQEGKNMTGFEIPAILPILGKASIVIFSFYKRDKRLQDIENGINELSIAVRTEFNEVSGKLAAISDWFVDEIRCDALSVFSYVADSVFIESHNLRTSLLPEAYRLSTKLTNLNVKGKIVEGYGSDNEIGDEEEQRAGGHRSLGTKPPSG